MTLNIVPDDSLFVLILKITNFRKSKQIFKFSAVSSFLIKCLIQTMIQTMPIQKVKILKKKRMSSKIFRKEKCFVQLKRIIRTCFPRCPIESGREFKKESKNPKNPEKSFTCDLSLPVKFQSSKISHFFSKILRMFNLTRTRLVPSWRISMRNLFITTEGTPNPNALKFCPGRDVLGPGKTCDFPDIRDAYKVMCITPHPLRNFYGLSQESLIN